MNTQKFYCLPNFGIGVKAIEIDIPTHCPSCNVELKVGHIGEGGDVFNNSFEWNDCCVAVFQRYPTIWAKYGPSSKAAIQTYPDGVVCMRCHGRNPYAIPNRPNGEYMCYEYK